ncbi:16S rRNA (cytosine(967)-C(5))-methyltransferase RsmB [bacterium]|nr:16S rRNA (cytosine(967)-C(5))-methyltransferase RsmB [bacterium]
MTSSPPLHRTARGRAIDILDRVDAGAYANTLLDKERDSADARLLREIVLGTLTWRGRIDHILNAYLKQPIRTLKRPYANLLRSAAYQILHLDRVPSYAVVSESVNLARRGGKGLSSMVNAVLRGVSESRRQVQWPDPLSQPVDHLSTEYSHPAWLIERWVKRFGTERTRALCEAGNTRPPLTIRTNLLRTTAKDLARTLEESGISTTGTPGLADSLNIAVAKGLFATAAHREGWFSVQGPGAARVSGLLEASTGDKILDVCAAPGGKAAVAASKGAAVIASDLSPSRIVRFKENANRLRMDIDIVVADARAIPFSAKFDHVLVDAPCTGLGTLSRHPEIRWRRQPSDIHRMASRQLEILLSAAGHVRSGGYLVYTTCTTEPQENEEVIEEFLRTESGFFRDCDDLYILPDIDGTDGAYGARLRKGDGKAL